MSAVNNGPGGPLHFRKAEELLGLAEQAPPGSPDALPGMVAALAHGVLAVASAVMEAWPGIPSPEWTQVLGLPNYRDHDSGEDEGGNG